MIQHSKTTVFVIAIITPLGAKSNIIGNTTKTIPTNMQIIVVQVRGEGYFLLLNMEVMENVG